jgi:hypothetical protein
VSPLTWSHASFVATVLEYMNKVGEVDICPSCGNPMDGHGHEDDKKHTLE